MLLDDILEKLFADQEEYENPAAVSVETVASVTEMPQSPERPGTAAA